MKLILSLLISITIISCKPNSSEKAASLHSIEPGMAHNFILQQENSNRFIIIDVRTPREFKQEHIHGAINIDWTNEDKRQQLIDSSKNNRVLVYCQSGNRSLAAANYLKQHSNAAIYNMTGGIVKWKQLIKSLTPDPKNEINSSPY